MSSKDIHYDINQSRENYMKAMREIGNDITLPAADELQLDIDGIEQMAVFSKAFPILKREIREEYGVTLKPDITPSRSGLPHCHIRITLPFKVDTWQRIAWQAALGSDPVRELLSSIRASRGDIYPTLLVEPAGTMPESMVLPAPQPFSDNDIPF